MNIAVVGPGASGKDTISELAVELYGYKHVSSSDIVRRHIQINGLGEIDRENCRLVASNLRKEFGPDVLVKKAFEMVPNKLVLSGLRAKAEAETFKRLGGVILAVSASAEVRFKRTISRQDIDSKMSYEKFLERDTVESSNPDPNAPNINAVLELADYHIINEKDKDTLIKDFRDIMDKIIK